MLSTTKVVTAAMRVTRSKKTNAPKFGLHVTLSESMSEVKTATVGKGDLRRKRKTLESEADLPEPKAKVGRTSEAAEPVRAPVTPMV
jgi:hypothetical protein